MIYILLLFWVLAILQYQIKTETIEGLLLFNA